MESQEFDWIVEHVPGKQHQAADYMSRVAARHSPPDYSTFEKQEAVYMGLSAQPAKDAITKILIDLDTWKKHQDEDATICLVRTRILSKNSDKTKYYCINNDGLVCYKPPNSTAPPRVWVPEALQYTVVYNQHNLIGHRGANSTIDGLLRYVYWPRMTKYIRRYVKACLDCQRRKTPRPWRSGLTGSFIATKPAQMFCIDFLGGTLPESPDGFKYALAVMDVFSRFPFVIPLKRMTSECIAIGLIEHVFCFSGLPIGVHSDNAPDLISEALQIVFRKFGVQRTTCSTHHPQGNAPVERFMRYLNSGFSIMLPEYPKWPMVLPLMLFAYRVLPHTTTGYSPFFLWYGREALLPMHLTTSSAPKFSYNQGDTKSYADQMIKMMSDTFTLVRQRQDKASRNNAARRDLNEKRQHITFDRGDPVLFFEPDAASGTGCETRDEITFKKAKEIGLPRKWKMQWSGPHTIKQQLRDNVYEYYHIHRKEYLTANVDRLVLYHPFKDMDKLLPVMPDTNADPTSIMDDTKDSKGHGQDQIDKLTKGDLCLVVVPNHRTEPIAVMRYLGDTQDGVEMQWLGTYKLYWFIDIRMFKQTWKNAWWDLKDRKFYYQHKPRPGSHDPAFTNMLSKDCINKTDIFFFGFNLMQDLRISHNIGLIALAKYREIGYIPDASADCTYELNQPTPTPTPT